MTGRIAVVSVPVADQDEAKRFYADVLGFAVIRDVPMGPGSRWIQLAPGGGETSISLVTWFDAMPPGSLRGLVLRVDDVAAARGRLVGKGLDLPEAKAEDWGRYTTFSDPDGNGWVLMEEAERPPG